MPERPAIHAYLSEPAHDAWHLFAEQGGCSVTAAIEDIGQTLIKKLAAGHVDDDADLKGWARRAAAIDTSRRRRSA